MFFKKCSGCGKMLFRHNNVIGEKPYCKGCFEYEKLQIRKREIQLEKEHRERKIKRIKRKIENKTLAKERLKSELLEEKKIHKKKSTPIIAEKKDKKKPIPKKIEPKETKDDPQDLFKTFSKDDIELYETLLQVDVTIKKIKAIEWFKGKKRVVLNRERELRRTHAGGFSAEKFQKHVDAMKRDTHHWLIDLLSRPGVLKEKYEKIIINSNNDLISEKLSEHFQSNNITNILIDKNTPNS